MTVELKDHKTVGRLNPNDNKLIRDLRDFMVPLRHIMSNLRNRNGRTVTNSKVFALYTCIILSPIFILFLKKNRLFFLLGTVERDSILHLKNEILMEKNQHILN